MPTVKNTIAKMRKLASPYQTANYGMFSLHIVRGGREVWKYNDRFINDRVIFSKLLKNYLKLYREYNYQEPHITVTPTPDNHTGRRGMYRYPTPAGWAYHTGKLTLARQRQIMRRHGSLEAWCDDTGQWEEK